MTLPVKQRFTRPIPASAEVLDLTMSSPELQSTPPRRPAPKHKASPLSPAVRRKRKKSHRSPSVIYLGSSSDGRIAVKDEISAASPLLHAPSRLRLSPAPVKREEAPPGLPTVKEEPDGNISVSVDQPQVGTYYATLDDAIRAVYQSQEVLGFKFRRAQVKRFPDSPEKKKQVLRCSSYQRHVPQHLDNIDPADHRRGKSVKTGCTARVNINRASVGSVWTITTADFEHNHSRTIPVGASALRPPTAQERTVIEQYATDHTFTRRHIGEIVQRSLPSSTLDARQLTNVIHEARRVARADIARLGGDFRAVQTALEKYKEDDPRWTYRLLINDDGKVTALFWQSPEQIRLAQAFHDVILNDNAANRNQYQFSLNIGVIIDGCRSSRNVWYALQEREDLHSYAWVFDCFLESTGNTPPGCLFSDRHPAVIAAADLRIPLTPHFFCLNHLNGNVADNLVPVLGQRWQSFLTHFFRVYWSPSPEEFDRRWDALLSEFPPARPYLQDHLYPIRQHWAWPWLSLTFTAGTRTTGRVEVENRVNKCLGGPTATVKQLFDKLNLRTSAQTAKETMQFRQVRRRRPTFWS